MGDGIAGVAVAARSSSIRRDVMTKHVSKDWLIAPPHASRERLASDAGISPVLAQVLLNRGIDSAQEARRFLNPEFRALFAPEQLPNAAEAARRIVAAARAGRKIVIYGDYDVDGVTATTILWHVLTIAGANVDYYIPSRMDEGYGLNGDALEKIAADGGQLVITVDCGITACAEAQRARALGIELIITDHHQPRTELLPSLRTLLPEADCIVHPTACGRESPNVDLSGAGVAFKVAWAIAQLLSESDRVSTRYRDFLVEATGFAALGLIADVVPLTAENRIIATFGLKQLFHTTNPGLQALIEVSGLAGKRDMGDYEVGFQLAPRLNAIGRLGHAADAVEMFTRANAERAREIAGALDGHNRSRQAIERGILRQAEAMVTERKFDHENCKAIVLGSRDWHVGVVGIVASRLVDRFHRPTVLVAIDADGEAGSRPIAHGSGRSIRNFPLHEALAACSEHLLSHGGHAMAAGVKLHADQLDGFTRAFQDEAGRRLTLQDLRPKLSLEDEVCFGDLAAPVVENLQRMAPFGIGNPRPLFCTRTVELAETPRIVGKTGQHLQLLLREVGEEGADSARGPSMPFASRGGGAGAANGYRKAIAFGMGRLAEQFSEHRRMRLAFEPIFNDWNGTRRVEFKVVDVQYQ